MADEDTEWQFEDLRWRLELLAKDQSEAETDDDGDAERGKTGAAEESISTRLEDLSISEQAQVQTPLASTASDTTTLELRAHLTKEKEIRGMSFGFLAEPRGEWHAPVNCECSKCWSSRHAGFLQ